MKTGLNSHLLPISDQINGQAGLAFHSLPAGDELLRFVDRLSIEPLDPITGLQPAAGKQALGVER